MPRMTNVYRLSVPSQIEEQQRDQTLPRNPTLPSLSDCCQRRKDIAGKRRCRGIDIYTAYRRPPPRRGTGPLQRLERMGATAGTNGGQFSPHLGDPTNPRAASRPNGGHSSRNNRSGGWRWPWRIVRSCGARSRGYRHSVTEGQQVP
jgi:hypothetical protein